MDVRVGAGWRSLVILPNSEFSKNQNMHILWRRWLDEHVTLNQRLTHRLQQYGIYLAPKRVRAIVNRCSYICIYISIVEWFGKVLNVGSNHIMRWAMLILDVCGLRERPCDCTIADILSTRSWVRSLTPYFFFVIGYCFNAKCFSCRFRGLIFYNSISWFFF